MIRRFRFVLLAAALFLIQTALVHRFTHRFLRPDVLCVAAVYLALEAHFRDALWGGFVLATGGLLFLRDRLMRDSFLTDLILTFAYVLFCGVVHALATAAVTTGPQSAALLERAFGQAAFTTAVGPLFFATFAKLGVVDRSNAALARSS